MNITALDHFVLTVSDLETACRFYGRVLGLEVVTSPEGRQALRVGRSRINLHPFPSPIQPRAARPSTGTADFCLLTAEPLPAVIGRLRDAGVEIELGPVPRQGAAGPMMSVYLRDPDGNLVELAHPLD